MRIPAKYVPPITIPFGQVVRYGGRLFEYRGRASDREHRHVFAGRDGVPLDMNDTQLLEAARKGEIILLSPERAEFEAGEREVAPPSLANASDEDIAEARRRQEYCIAWRRAGRPARSAVYLAAIMAEVAARRGEAPPSPRTFVRWIADWVSCGEVLDGLLPGRGGNRKDRLDPDARDLLRKTVLKHYLVDTRPTAVAVHRYVVAAFERHNAPLPLEDKLQTPSLNAVYAQIAEVDAYTLDFSRFGPRKAAERHRPKGDGPIVERHNQVWEVDHTTVNAVAIDAVTGMPLGRPVVTVILDRFSRVIVGFRIGWERPSANVVLDALKIAISPKQELLDLHPQARGPWPCFGVPDLLVTDQGKEFKSRSFIEACLSVGFDVEYTPVLKAWYKGRVERFFGTLSREIFHRVPGTTFADIFERNGEAIPEKVAVLTLPELEDLTFRWIVDVYHRRPHRALAGRSPLTVWTESVQKTGIRLPPGPEELAVKLARTVFRKPQPYGIEFEGLIYNSPDVGAFNIRPGRPPVVKVRVDRTDLTKIWFIDPDDGRPVEVPIKRSMRPLVEGLTLEKHQRVRAIQNQNPERFAGAAGLQAALDLIDRQVEQGLRADGLQNRQRAASEWAKLNRIPKVEDAPAFDIEGSAENVFDIDGVDVDVEREAPDADAAHPATDTEAPVRRRKAKPGTEVPAEAVARPEDDDIAALLAETGMRVTRDSKGEQT